MLDADIGRATQSVSRIAGATGELQSALRETRGRDLLRRAAAAVDAVPERLRLQRQTLGILQQSLAIQRSTERHAASLDRKTAGTAPVAAPAPAPAALTAADAFRCAPFRRSVFLGRVARGTSGAVGSAARNVSQGPRPPVRGKTAAPRHGAGYVA